MLKTKLPTIDSLSDLDPKTALATLAAMEYSDIIHLSYRQALRLWVAVPSIRRKTYADRMRQVAAREPRVEWLKEVINDLEYAKRYTRDSKGWFTEETELPSVLANKVWAAAATEEKHDHLKIGGNCDSGLSFESKTKNPDFIYSEDGTDLQWVG
jgi:hypothetical protein